MFDLVVRGKCSQGAGAALALGYMLLDAGYAPGLSASSSGREGLKCAIEEMTETKPVCFNL